MHNITRRIFVKSAAASAVAVPLLGADCPGAAEQCASDPECVEAVVSLTVLLIKVSFAVAEAINAQTKWFSEDDFERTIQCVIELVDSTSGVVVDSVEKGVRLPPGEEVELELGGVSSDNSGEYFLRFLFLGEKVLSDTLTVEG